jgi:hypothetical protein
MDQSAGVTAAYFANMRFLRGLGLILHKEIPLHQLYNYRFVCRAGSVISSKATDSLSAEKAET